MDPGWLFIFCCFVLITPTLLVMLLPESSRSRRRKAREEDIKRLMAMTGQETVGDLVDEALTFYFHAAEAIMAGKIVGTRDREGEFVQILTPGLKWAKDVTQVTDPES